MKILKKAYDCFNNYIAPVEESEPEEFGIGALVTGDVERLFSDNNVPILNPVRSDE